MSRFIVQQTYVQSLGQVSMIHDTQSARRILVGGTNHAARAEARAKQLNSTDQDSCCPSGGPAPAPQPPASGE